MFSRDKSYKSERYFIRGNFSDFSADLKQAEIIDGNSADKGSKRSKCTAAGCSAHRVACQLKENNDRRRQIGARDPESKTACSWMLMDKIIIALLD